MTNRIDRNLGEDSNSTHTYEVHAADYDDKKYYRFVATDAYVAERKGKLLFQADFGRTPLSVSARLTPNAKLPGETALVDEMDEQAARLLKAIETMCDELRAGRANEALITGIMALSEHRARLVDHSVPSHMAAMWENDKEDGSV